MHIYHERYIVLDKEKRASFFGCYQLLSPFISDMLLFVLSGSNDDPCIRLKYRDITFMNAFFEQMPFKA
jgi:hypothetical protein